MRFATHAVKINGHFDVETWGRDEIYDYVNEEIELLDDGHADIELLNTKGNTLELWIFIHEPFLSPKTLKSFVLDWIKKNASELGSNGLHMDEITVEEIKGYWNGMRIMINTPEMKKESHRKTYQECS